MATFVNFERRILKANVAVNTGVFMRMLCSGQRPSSLTSVRPSQLTRSIKISVLKVFVKILFSLNKLSPYHSSQYHYPNYPNYVMNY